MIRRLPSGSTLTLIVAATLSLMASWVLWFYAKGGPLYLLPVMLTAFPFLAFGRFRETVARSAAWALGAFMLVFTPFVGGGLLYAPSVLALVWYSLPNDE